MTVPAASASYKPSPLGFGTPRASPFRRPGAGPESPISPSPLRSTIGPGASTALSTPTQPSKLHLSPTMPFANRTAVGGGDSTPASSPHSWTPKGRVSAAAESFQQQQQQTPTPPSSGMAPRANGFGHAATKSSSLSQTNALAQLQPTQMRMLRDGFEILDRDGDGVVNREDVADMLTQLGLPSNPSNIAHFFPPSAPQTTTLPAYLNSIATALAALSPAPELLSALSAFDDDDSGQVDLAELRDALLHTAPDPGEASLTEAEIDRVLSGFSGRRAFTNKKGMGGGMGMGMNGKRGDVFRYQEFVGSVMGSNGGSGSASAEGSED